MHKVVCAERRLGWKKQCLHTVTLKIFTPHQIVSLVCWQQWDFSPCKAVKLLAEHWALCLINPSQIPARWVVRVKFPAVSEENRLRFIFSPLCPHVIKDICHLMSEALSVHYGSWGWVFLMSFGLPPLCWWGNEVQEEGNQFTNASQLLGQKIQAQCPNFLPREMQNE